ncbi:uncharacterized protein LOC129730443 [Wyeomyia smithii]|uniref:uncharacterized protein LOC129730443 n=1 Tax=Wyeomyia smithii TaxID=174621 RepID=UPI00246817FA|nr:uncharacterized protein LOC129730443 [Wyeomyia smithii]
MESKCVDLNVKGHDSNGKHSNDSQTSQPEVETKMSAVKRRLDSDLNDDGAPGLEPQKKLCRFFYLDDCAELSCRYMHSEFPCKYYYFGLKCRDGKRCKLRHGTALQPDMEEALWNHIKTAPANILQHFPCFPEALLKKNYEERHSELLLMEREGLITDKKSFPKNNLSNPISSTLLSEAIKTFTRTQQLEEALVQASELKDILTYGQIVTLANNGVRSKDSLFTLNSTTLLELGFDDNTLKKIERFKNIHNEQTSSAEIDNKFSDLVKCLPGLEEGSAIETIVKSTEKQDLTDQELLSILNDDSTPSTISITSPIDFTIASSSSNNDENGSSKKCLFKSTPNRNDEDLRDVTKPKVLRIGSLLNLGFSLSQMEMLEKEQGILLTPSGTPAYKSAGDSGDLKVIDASLCHRNLFGSDESDKLQQMLSKENETNSEELESVKRIVEQVCKIDSSATNGKESDIGWASEGDIDLQKFGSPVTDSANQSCCSDSDSQTRFQMPFKSMIDFYTPAQEIEASNGKFPSIDYRLIPIDIPVPNFERVRESFVIEPTYSLDPRIQLMFNVGSSEIVCIDSPRHSARDPRLNKQQLSTSSIQPNAT